jgi:hypothetical protein
MGQGDLDESHWSDVAAEAFEAGWRAEAIEAVDRPHIERFFLATGRLLPIWTMLGDAAQVRRLVTQDGRAFLGRIVTPDAVNTLLGKLGAGRASSSPVRRSSTQPWRGRSFPLAGSPACR